MNEIELPNMLPYVDFLMTADRAEAVNGKLYLMGGGWDRLFVGDFAKQPHSIGLAIGVVIPWAATHEEHRLVIRITDDHDVEAANGQVGFRAGAPPMMERAESQRVILAMRVEAKIEHPGIYTVQAIVNDDLDARRSRQTEIYVKAKPVPAQAIT